MSDYCGLRGCVTKPGDDCEVEHCPRFSGRKRIAELEAEVDRERRDALEYADRIAELEKEVQSGD